MVKRGSFGVRVALYTVTICAMFFVVHFVGNMALHLLGFSSYNAGDGDVCDQHGEAAVQPVGLSRVQRQKGCDTIEDFIEDGDYEKSTDQNPWRQMKWGLPPAKCRVNGHLIERLDPTYNYRRGVALRFTGDLDDKSHVEHWFLGTKVDLNQRKRRVFIDLGANYFHTSVVWFNQRYPCDFTEVHAFEIDPNLFQLPQGFDEEENWVDSNQTGWYKIKGREGHLPKWMIERIHYYNKFAGDADDQSSVNITRFIRRN
ncbi:unnamed protein product [Calypogeia fissa]